MAEATIYQKKVILTGLVALLLSAFAASGAGMLLGEARELLTLIPGLIVILPPSLNMRGSISGVLASRLSSSMHLGEFEVSFERGSVLGDNLRASFAVTVLVAVVIGVFAYLVSTAVGIEVVSIIDLVLISVLTCIISGIFIILITLVVSLASFRFSLDLDMIAAPTVTTSGDVITIPILLISAVVVTGLPWTVRWVLCTLSVLLALGILLYSRYRTREIWSIVREVLPLLVPLCLLGTFAGLVLNLELGDLIVFAALLVFIPPFMNGCGSIGGILCSRLATEMHLGIIDPSVLPKREVMPHFLTTYLYTLILLPLMALFAHGAALMLGLPSPGLPVMVGISVISGIIVMSLVTVVAYLTASASFRYGLDPDNFGIPVVTSLIDFIGAVVLITVIGLMI